MGTTFLSASVSSAGSGGTTAGELTASMSLSAMGLKVLSPFSASLAIHDLLRFVCVRNIERLSLLKRIQAGFKLAGELAVLLGHLVRRIDLKHRAAKLLHFADIGRLANGRLV